MLLRILVVAWVVFIMEAKAQKHPYTMQADVSGLVANSVRPVVGAQVFNGIKIDKWFIEPGITIGIDAYQQFTVLPVYGSIRWLPSGHKSPAPYIGVNVGYGLTWLERSSDLKSYRGGSVFNPLVGLRMRTKSRANLNIGIGFKQQKATIIEREADDMGRLVWELSETYKFSRVSLSFGVGF